MIRNLNKEEESKVFSKDMIRQQSQIMERPTHAIFGEAWVRVHNLSILQPHNKFQSNISTNVSKNLPKNNTHSLLTFLDPKFHKQLHK